MQITLEYYEIQILGLIDAPGAQCCVAGCDHDVL
eukprot:COSAG02_NODE_54954_length_293_cov_0.798969_1_plen_34_part_10